MPVVGLGHTGLWVHDLEKMRDFYERVIGVFWAQQLDRYRAFKQQVRGLPHLADAARCYPLVQSVAVIQYQARSRHNADRLP